MEVTYNSFAYTGQKMKTVALKEMQKYKSLEKRGGHVWPRLHFVSRMPLEKFKVRREAHLLKPYTHLSHTIPKQGYPGMVPCQTRRSLMEFSYLHHK